MLRKYLSGFYGFVRNKFFDIRDCVDYLNARIHNRKIIYSLYARVNNFGDQVVAGFGAAQRLDNIILLQLI